MKQENYQEKGYLNRNFKIFHLTDTNLHDFSYHYHAFNKILIPISGNITYHIEGHSYHLEPYDVVLVNAGEIHKPEISGDVPYERIVIYISNDFIKSYTTENYSLLTCFEKASAQDSHVLRMNSLSTSKLFATVTELENTLSDDGYASELYAQILFLEFMVLLNRAAIVENVSYLKTDISNQKVLQLMEYINSHLTEELNIDFLAEEFFLDKYYLMHLFKEAAGCTIGNYLTSKRLQKANDLIKTGMPITTACYECGFKNYSTFSRAYKKYFNCSPKEKNLQNLSTSYLI